MKRLTSGLLLILTFALLVSGCIGERLIEPELGEYFDLPLGQDAVVLGEDLRLTFEEVLSDSRCPLSVECVRAGEAVYTITAKKGGESQLLTLSEEGLGGEGQAVFQGYGIVALLQPYPNQPDAIEPEEYYLNIIVSKPVSSGMSKEAEIYTAIIRRIVTKDNSFGDDPPPIPNLYIVYTTTDKAGDPMGPGGEHRVLEPGLRNSIAGRLADLGSAIRWVEKFADAPLTEDRTVEGGGAIVELGNIHEVDGETQVAVSIYFASLAAAGRTYILEEKDGAWQITGDTGMIWVS